MREKKAGKSAPEMKVAGPVGLAMADGKLHLGPTLEAPVTQGTAGKNVLSHDALNQITHQVNLLGKAKQDGEIKIRLKPDHLGELMMNVKTNGQRVTLEIKAQDHESKRIIEESLGRLKDSLASQSLDLGKVEVVAQAAPGQSADSGIQMDLGQHNRGFQNGQAGQESGFQREGRQEFLFDEAPRSGNLESMRANRSIRSSGPGTLDLIA
ncbi:MAG: flagellar hook-length control protein FliK [Proteobacteria bacterium]|nr:flagellar hook-length control protein FliK [Pseudomonadota bacterium]